MKAYRVFVFFLRRVRNCISSYFNRLLLTLNGVSYGKHCVIHGRLYLKLFPTAKVTIGDDLYFASGWNINALCVNKRGTIYATHHAEITIGNNVGMSSTVIWCHHKISIGNNVKLGAGVILMDTDAHSIDYKKRRTPHTDYDKRASIVIEDDVLVGVNSIVLKGVTIGARSIIGAGSVVTKNIPQDCIAAGNPAQIIRYLK